MNPAKYHDTDYIQFLVGTQLSYSCLEAAKVQPEPENQPAHDAITRPLHRKIPNAEELWGESQSVVNKINGILVVDDSSLDKPYARKIQLVTHHWSGKHHRVVRGINLLAR